MKLPFSKSAVKIIPWLLMVIACGNVFAQQIIKPMTLVSNGKPCFVSTGDKTVLFDRDLSTFWYGADTSWIAVRVGSGFSKLLLHWIPAEYTTWRPYWQSPDSTGTPGYYQILVSENSSNGTDGTWSTVVIIANNPFAGRMHSFDFTAKQWVKLLITGRSWSKMPIVLAELELFDASNGIEDTWFFMGNSITSGAFDNRITPSFSQNISSSHPGYTPAMINGGYSGMRTSEGVSVLDLYLSINPDLHYWCMEYGTNDSRDNMDTLVFKANLDTMIRKITAAGHVPMIAQVPWSAPNYSVTPAYSRMISQLNVKYNLLPGPDLYTWFKNHPTEIKPNGDVHPNDSGDISINRLWAQAVAPLYPSTVGNRHLRQTSFLNAAILRVAAGTVGMMRLTATCDGIVVVSRLNGQRVASVPVRANSDLQIPVGNGAFVVRFSRNSGVAEGRDERIITGGISQ